MLTIGGTPFPELKIITLMRNKREIKIYLQINKFIPLEKVAETL